MSFASEFYDWQSHGAPAGHGVGCSPNLKVLLAAVQARWPFFTNLGCFGRRPIRGSTTVLSSHTYGAALDLGYPPDMDDVVGSHVAGFLVAWSQELGLQMIGDYRRCRIWKAGRTANLDEACTLWWKAQRPSAATGMGQSWANHLHVETPPTWWGERSSVEARGVI